MKKGTVKSVIILFVLLLLSTGCMFMADRIQRDNGNVDIINGTLETDEGVLAYKLYKPKSANELNKAPAVLLLHGYQNDHETCGAYAIELARRGAVVLALDEYGHGATTVGLINRGYVNHKVTVNYGNDSESDKTFVEVSSKGAERYRLMMNFSNLSFFNDHYSKDNDGNSIKDSSCGGITAYAYMATLPYVDSSRMALSGHSMGTWSSWSVAAAFSGTPIEPRATVLQCGELFRDSVYDTEAIHFNNVLLLQAKWDEFSYFRDYEKVVSDDLLKSELRNEFLKTTPIMAAWNTTFGNFADGSARRMQLLYTNHRLTTHNKTGLAVSLEWFDKAIGLNSTLAYSDITALNKEYLVLAAMLLVLLAMFPLMNIMTNTVFQAAVVEKPSEYDIKPFGSRLKGALITILLSAATFPFLTQLGHGLLPLPENIFRMTVGNGFLCWYLVLIVIMLITSIISRAKAARENAIMEKFNFVAFIEGLLMAVIMCGMVYLINWAYTSFFNLDLRFIWPFFRTFNTERAIQFGIYIPVFALFYLLNNTKIMRDMRIKATYKEGLGGFMVTWLHNFIIMVGGILIVVAIEYVPFFLDLGPGADLLFGSTFGGPFMSILILFVPQIMFFSLVCTYCYRKTGKVYTGALVAAILACWIVTGGSAIL